MSHLTVLRHSLATANEQGLLMGPMLDCPLSVEGIALARNKGHALKANGYKPDVVFSSQLSRAKKTAETIIEVLGIKLGITELEWLNERDFGKYDGQPIQELLDAFLRYGPNPPTVETFDHFVGRIVRGLDEVHKDTSKNILIVTHSNTLNAMKAVLLKQVELTRFWETDIPEYCEGFEYGI